MPELKPMPPVGIRPSELARFGAKWQERGGSLSRTPPESSGQLGQLFDHAVGSALAEMLGDVPIVTPNRNALIPTQANVVEVGPVKIVGGVRPQEYDVGYRPDGPRFVFDSKTLNDTKSVGKNFLNMVNDLATEATTVHTRFPFAVVGFMFVVPRPCVDALPKKSAAAIDTLDRLARRFETDEPDHLAEAISVVVWDPETGRVDPAVPEETSRLRLERFSSYVERAYVSRYEGLPPHERPGLPTTPAAEDETTDEPQDESDA